jgi:uncharacterized protein (DUF3084 family)
MTIIGTTSDTVTSQFVEEGHQPSDRQAYRLPSSILVGGPLRVSSSSASRSGSVAAVAMSRSPHGNTFRIVVAWIRFSARFRRADRSSSSVLLSVNERTGVGPVRNRVLSGFSQDPHPLRSPVVQQMLLN